MPSNNLPSRKAWIWPIFLQKKYSYQNVLSENDRSPCVYIVFLPIHRAVHSTCCFPSTKVQKKNSLPQSQCLNICEQVYQKTSGYVCVYIYTQRERDVHHITLNKIISYYIMYIKWSYNVISHHTIFHHIVLYHIRLCSIISYHIISCYTTSYKIMILRCHHITWYYIIVHCIISNH